MTVAYNATHATKGVYVYDGGGLHRCMLLAGVVTQCVCEAPESRILLRQSAVPQTLPVRKQSTRNEINNHMD